MSSRRDDRRWAARAPRAAPKRGRDGCNAFEARAKGIRWLATQLGLDAASSTIHTLDLDACRNALRLVEQFMSRKSPPAHS